MMTRIERERGIPVTSRYIPSPRDFHHGKVEAVRFTRWDDDLFRGYQDLSVELPSMRRKLNDENPKEHRNSDGILPLSWRIFRPEREEGRLAEDNRVLFTFAARVLRSRRYSPSLCAPRTQARVIDDSRGGGTMTSGGKGRVRIILTHGFAVKGEENAFLEELRSPSPKFLDRKKKKRTEKRQRSISILVDRAGLVRDPRRPSDQMTPHTYPYNERTKQIKTFLPRKLCSETHVSELQVELG